MYSHVFLQSRYDRLKCVELSLKYLFIMNQALGSTLHRVGIIAEGSKNLIQASSIVLFIPPQKLDRNFRQNVFRSNPERHPSL